MKGLKIYKLIGFVIIFGCVLFTLFNFIYIFFSGSIKWVKDSLVIFELIIVIIGIPYLFIILNEMIKHKTQ